jgi:hypothetical protein
VPEIPFCILPAGSYFGDYFVLNDFSLLYCLEAIKDDELKTFAPEELSTCDARFTATMQDKYKERRKHNAKKFGDGLVNEVKDEDCTILMCV